MIALLNRTDGKIETFMGVSTLVALVNLAIVYHVFHYGKGLIELDITSLHTLLLLFSALIFAINFSIIISHIVMSWKMFVADEKSFK